MSYRNLNTSIIIRLILLALLVSGFSISLFYQQWAIAVFLLVMIVFSFFNIVYYVNAVNRKISFFFDAIQNEDGTLTFPEKLENKSLKQLHISLNRINRVLSEMKVKQEHKEKFFLEFMKRSATGLMAVDQQGFVEIINDAALKITGLTHLTHLQRLQQYQPEIFDALVNLKAGQNRTLKVVKGTELKHISIKVAPLNFGQMQYRVFSLNDIKAEMEENELETWKKIVRIMTHEIMNSIAPITSISRTLSGLYSNDNRRKNIKNLTQREIDNTVQGLSVIEDRSRGLLNFVDNYRKLTRIPPPIFKSIILDKWMECILLLFQNRIDTENIQLNVILKFNRNEFLGDEKLLTQVVLNLLNNAADALANVENKKIIIMASPSRSGTLILEIIDNGKGFDFDELDKIFLPFYTTKENGSGIGLSLSRQIMRLHKGSISAYSDPGKKTVFELMF
jgi:two-component system, NtrC family, nitrogen regulation sensor histidine kinase NtrY